LRDKTEEIIYRDRKTNYLSTHEGLERGGDYSKGEKAKEKALEHFFKKLTNSLIDRNRSIK